MKDALPQPVVPIVYYGQAIEPNASHAFCKQILEAMPETNYNVFYYIISLGRELVNPSKYKNQVIYSLTISLLFPFMVYRFFPSGHIG